MQQICEQELRDLIMQSQMEAGGQGGGHRVDEDEFGGSLQIEGIDKSLDENQKKKANVPGKGTGTVMYEKNLESSLIDKERASSSS